MSAVLLSRGHRFVKHSGVRSGLHQHLVKAGLLAEAWGKLYDQRFEERQHADYVEFVTFERDDIRMLSDKVANLVTALEKLALA